jgi:hypothetical protein
VNGKPALPAFLARLLLPVILTPKAQSRADREGIQSSAGIIAFCTQADDREAWIRSGVAYQRFALAATREGVRNTFINQPIEVRRLRLAPRCRGSTLVWFEPVMRTRKRTGTFSNTRK